MAPRFTAPKVWRRPYTSIYNDNYRYGNSLYEGAINDIERKYHEALSKTFLRGDRLDLNFSSFANSHLSDTVRDRAFVNAAAAAATASIESNLSLARSHSSTRANYSAIDESRKLQKSNSYDAYRTRAMENLMQADIEETRLRRSRSRSRRRPESAYGAISQFEDAVLGNSADTHGHSFWTERCRELQNEIETLNHQFSETENKLKHESTAIKNKLNQEVADLIMAVDDQDRQMGDLQKLLKKQTKQISDLTLELEGSQRHYTDAFETLAQAQRRCQNLVHEVDEMRSSLDKHLQKSSVESHTTCNSPYLRRERSWNSR